MIRYLYFRGEGWAEAGSGREDVNSRHYCAGHGPLMHIRALYYNSQHKFGFKY